MPASLHGSFRACTIFCLVQNTEGVVHMCLQASVSVVEAAAAAGPAAAEDVAVAATSVVESNAGAPSLDLAQVGSVFLWQSECAL